MQGVGTLPLNFPDRVSCEVCIISYAEKSHKYLRKKTHLRKIDPLTLLWLKWICAFNQIVMPLPRQAITDKLHLQIVLQKDRHSSENLPGRFYLAIITSSVLHGSLLQEMS